MIPARFAGITLFRTRDQESWTEAFTLSAVLHAGLFLALFLLGAKPPLERRMALTEVRFIERAEVSAAPVIDAPGPALGAGHPAATIGRPGKTETGASHPEMPNVVPLSSPQGTPDGEVVTARPMTGPIVSVETLGLVGRKKGALAPLAGRTEGRPIQGLTPKTAGMITGQEGMGLEGSGTPIALSTEEMSSLRKREAALGVPLIGEPVVAESVKKTVPKGSILTPGTHALSRETLKANPLAREEWGKKKGPFSMEGPLKYRKILSMELPPYPRWAEEKAIEATVSFRLWVDPRGVVKSNFYLEKTSGYSELDALARDALYKFRFVALPAEQPQEDEWGVATFRFELRQ